MNTQTQNALNTAIASMSSNAQMRIKSVDNLGAEMILIERKECKLPSKTRAVLVELAERVNMYGANGVYL